MQGKIVSFGEIMLRLSAGAATIAESDAFDACYGGTEANVLAAMAAFGHETKYLTALPDNALGEACRKHLEHFGIDTSDVIVRGDLLGLYFLESGDGSRGANVIYYRKFSEVARLDEDAFDYDKVFADAALFHISGISFALSESARRLSFRLVKEAKRRGIPVSFDFNYRAKLWTTEAAGKVFREVMRYADIALASHLDLGAFLDTDEAGFFARYPECGHLVLRDRRILAPDRHAVTVAVLNGDGKIFRSTEYVFPVKEKIGGGDAFDAAMLHALLTGQDEEAAIAFAVSAFALKHTLKGDTFTLGADDVLRYHAVLETVK